MSVRIRRLRPADYADMIALFGLAGLEPRVRGRDARAPLTRQLRSRHCVYLGAFDGDRLVGTVLGTHDLRKGWINRLAVHPDYRRRGLAARLVRACERGLRQQGVEMFAALIDGDNAASQRLFAKLGYESMDIRYYRRKLRDEV